MSVLTLCDFCGDPIQEQQRVAVLNVNTSFRPGAWSHGNLGHFHNSANRDCFSDLGCAIEAFIAAHKSLETIPVLAAEPEMTAEPEPEPIAELSAEIETQLVEIETRAVEIETQLGSAPESFERRPHDRPGSDWVPRLVLELECERRLAERRAAQQRYRSAAAGPGGITDAEFLSDGTRAALIGAGIVTIAQLEAAFRDGALSCIAEIGAQRLRTIEKAMRDRMARVEREFLELLDEIGYRCRHALPRAGVCSLDHVACMTDAELLAIDGVGQKTVGALREAVRTRAGLPR